MPCAEFGNSSAVPIGTAGHPLWCQQCWDLSCKSMGWRMAAERSLPSTLPFHCPLCRKEPFQSVGLQAVTVMIFQVMGWETNSPQLSFSLCLSDTRARKDRAVFPCKWNFSACIALGGSRRNSKGVSCSSHRSD